MDITGTVAGNVRRIRLSRGLTLDAAAAETGVSRSMLAQLEKGEVNPTVSVLWKIANGYRVSFTSLLESEGERVSLLRAGDTPPLSEDGGRYLNYPVFGFDEKRQFETYRIVIEPGGSLSAGGHLKGSEEYITVFSGEVAITAGDEHFDLAEGDSIRFLADVQHSYRNTGSGRAQLSMLIYYAQGVK